MEEFTRKGVGTAGLTTGIIGTTLGVANGVLELISAHKKNGSGCTSNGGGYVGSDASVIVGLQSENALLKANTYNDQKMLEVYAYIDGQLKDVRSSIAAQDVTNAKIEGTFAVLGEKLSAQRNEFMCALNREKDERCCGDNAIVNYTNATFYPKMVASVTTGTDTVAQPTYNPIPKCGCCG